MSIPKSGNIKRLSYESKDFPENFYRAGKMKHLKLPHRYQDGRDKESGSCTVYRDREIFGQKTAEIVLCTSEREKQKVRKF